VEHKGLRIVSRSHHNPIEIANTFYKMATEVLMTDKKAALKIFRSVLTHNPEHTLAIEIVASLLIDEEMWRLAEPHCRNLVKLRPYFAEGHFLLALVLHNRSSKRAILAEAMKEYELALKYNPSHANAHFGLGELCTRHVDSLRHYRQVLRLSSDAEQRKLVLERIDILRHFMRVERCLTASA